VSFAQGQENRTYRDLSYENQESWKRVLFYQGEQSVARKSFFLSENGRSDPEAEYQVLVKRLKKGFDEKIHCAYPRRLTFIQQVNKNIDIKIPFGSCDSYSKFQHTVLSQGQIRLAYTDPYLENPASTFGHLFLLLERTSGRAKASMLDIAVNFAVDPGSATLSEYFLKGLFGGFEGRFFVRPYFSLVQEYNIMERRDIWEYPLKLTRQQKINLMDSLWELRFEGFDYKFLSLNCASMMNLLIQAATGQDHWNHNQDYIISPIATVQGLKPLYDNDIGYRPSIRTQLWARFDKLSKSSQKLVTSSLDTMKIPSKVHTLEEAGSAAVLDTIADAVDYLDEVSGLKAPEKYADLRNQSLRQRSKIKAYTDSASRKHRGVAYGHPESRLDFHLIGSRDLMRKSINFRPYLHSASDPMEGYMPDSEFQLAEIEAVERGNTAVEKRFDIQRFRLIGLSSTPLYRGLGDDLSWSVNVDFLRGDPTGVDYVSPEGTVKMTGGLGSSISWAQHAKFIFLSLLEVGSYNEDQFVGLGYKLEHRFFTFSGININFGMHRFRYFYQNRHESKSRSYASGQVSINRTQSLRAELASTQGKPTVKVGFSFYF